jgi:hypothetical protein
MGNCRWREKSKLLMKFVSLEKAVIIAPTGGA